MNKNNPKTRTEASAPEATSHLSEKQKMSLDLQADAEHAGGVEREKLTRKIEELGNSVKPTVKRGRTNQSP